jgi:hypothetical protein
MPVISKPSHLRDWSDGDRDRSETAPRSLAVRMRVAIRREALTRALAGGTDPSSSPELATRAAQLTSDRSRKQLARSLRRALTEAYSPALTRTRISIINRRAVLDAEEAVTALISRLRSPEPVSADGMAMTEQMLTNGDSSPLYNRAEPGTLRRHVLVATAALDPTADEMPLAA